MKVSEITPAKAAEYLRLDGELNENEISELTMMIEAASAFIQSYTGLDAEQIDTFPDIAIAAFVLIQDMYDNRSMHIEKGGVNKTVETILGMHSVNLL